MSDKHEDEEISIDLSKVMNFFKKKKPTHKSKYHDGNPKCDTGAGSTGSSGNVSKPAYAEASSDEDDDSINLNLKDIFLKAYKKQWLIVALLILIPFVVSMSLRLEPSHLPITDDWASSSVYDSIRANLRAEIAKKYPTLPDIRKNSLVEDQLQQVIDANKAQIDRQIKDTSDYFKSKMKDENGTTYLIAIDPYFWWRHAKNIVDHGYPGDKIVNGVQIDDHMYAPLGRVVPKDMFHAYFEAYFYKFLRIFSPDIYLRQAAFYIPAILASLAVVPAFLIGRRFYGNFAGFIAAMITALHPSFISRTAAGFADTDAYNVLFPLIIVWLYIESFNAKDTKLRLMYSALASSIVGLFAFTWGGWWFVVWFIIAATGIYILLASIRFIKKRQSFKEVYAAFTADKRMSGVVIALLAFMLFSSVFVILITDYGTFSNFMVGLQGFSEIKDVGISKVWPNVFTTVAEQNEIDYKGIINSIGGSFLFTVSLIGPLVLFFRRKDKSVTGPKNKNSPNGRSYNLFYGALLVIWIAATFYASTKGVRWVLLMVPAFAISVGVASAFFYDVASRWFHKEMHLNKSLSKVAVALLVIFFVFIAPYNMVSAAKYTAKHEIPSMNDAWYNALHKIDIEAAPDAIINSWWDFGHWFKAVGDRAVTFDGTSQDTPMAHWVGNALLTNDEKLSVGILRMLDCGSNNAFEELDNVINKPYKSVEILYKIIIEDKDSAKDTLLDAGLTDKEAEDVLKYTHCEPPEDYFITSDDMVGKAGVWAHFGSWDFRKATILNKIKNSDNMDESIAYLKSEFGYDDEQATSLYYEVAGLNAGRESNDWVAPWPSYLGSLTGCTKKGSTLLCQNGVEVDLDTKEAYIMTQTGKMHPVSLVYPTFLDIEKKEFSGKTVPYSVVLVPDSGGNYRSVICFPELADSMFTRLFFLKGHGLKHFDLFTYERSFSNNEIYVWKIDWNGRSSNIEETFLPKEEYEVSHILIRTDTRNESEAKRLINEVYEKADIHNFADLAKNYSDDESSEKGGYLGWVSKGKLIPEFEAVFTNMTINEISKPFKSRFGYHIILLSGKRGGIDAISDTVTVGSS